MFLLDANVVLHLANEVQGHERILARVNEAAPGAARISAFTAYELRYSLGKGRASRRRLAALAAWIRYFKALPFGPIDTLAAGHALAIGYTLVTDNEREFGRVAGLRVQNWLR